MTKNNCYSVKKFQMSTTWLAGRFFSSMNITVCFIYSQVIACSSTKFLDTQQHVKMTSISTLGQCGQYWLHRTNNTLWSTNQWQLFRNDVMWDIVMDRQTSHELIMLSVIFSASIKLIKVIHSYCMFKYAVIVSKTFINVASAGLRWVLLMLQHQALSKNRPI